METTNTTYIVSIDSTSERVRENVKLNYVLEDCHIEEEAGSTGWLKIGGVALVEGESRNKNVYTKANLEENDDKEFKWLFGHPEKEEDHVVGLGKLSVKEGSLYHEGKIRNTKNHPDVVEQVRDKFLGPSIHASAKKIIEKEGKYFVEGLSIEGVGLVAFQGVKNATIDYAIAESFKQTEQIEQKPIEGLPKTEPEVKPMDEIKAEVAPAIPIVEAPKVSVEDFNKIKEELELLKKDMKERSIKANAVVETVKKESDGIVENKGDFTFSESYYKKFNEDLRNRVR